MTIDRPTITPDPDRDGVILHLPEITYLDTQTWAVDVGLTAEGLAALRAALGVSAVVEPPADRAALRERIRRVICEAEGAMWNFELLEPDEYGEVADAVLAVLPPSVDRAAEAFTATDLVAALRSAGEERDEAHQKEVAELTRKLAAAERIRENADFHLGQEMARRQLAEKEAERLRAELAALPEPADRAALREAATIAESLRQFEPATGARKSAQVSENVGILRVAAELRRMADETAAAETEAERQRPVSLATPCAVCGHPYNWHTRHQGACEFAPVGLSRCGCTGFVPGERPEPVDPRHILGIDPEFAAGAWQDGATQ